MNMKRLLAIPFAFLVSAAAAAAAAVHTWPVDDGTTGALVEDHRVPRVGVVVEFPSGRWSPWFRESGAEPAFRIQFHDRKGELRALADRLGVDVSLTVGDRSATLRVDSFRDDLPAALGLVRAILANDDFDVKEIRIWNRQRALAWDGAKRTPVYRGAMEAARTFYRDGDPRGLDWSEPEPYPRDAGRLLAARDALVRLPGRTVAFAGDVFPDDAKRLAAGLLPEALAEPPPGTEPRVLPLRPAEERGGDRTVHLPRLTQVYFAYGRDSLPFDADDYPAFLVADHVLGGHFYSRLYVALRHEGGDTYGAGTRNLGDVEPGPYGLFSFTRTANATRAEGKIREVLATFREGGITADELRGAKGFLVGRRAFARQSPDQILAQWLRDRRLGLPEGFADVAARKASSLTLEEVNAFVARYYDPSAFRMVRVAPE